MGVRFWLDFDRRCCCVCFIGALNSPFLVHLDDKIGFDLNMKHIKGSC